MLNFLSNRSNAGTWWSERLVGESEELHSAAYVLIKGSGLACIIRIVSNWLLTSGREMGVVQVYDEKHVLQAQLDLLKKTKLVDLTIDKYKALHKTEEVPAELKDRRQNVVLQLKELKADCKQLLTVIEDPALAKVMAEKPSEGKESTRASQEKAFKDTLMQLVDKNSIEDAHIDCLGKYAKLHYECGNYGMVDGSEKMGAGEFLPIFQILCKERTGNADGALSALWGKLSTGILLEKWDETFEDIKELREFIDTKVFRDPLQQLQQRSWLLHWVSILLHFL